VSSKATRKRNSHFAFGSFVGMIASMLVAACSTMGNNVATKEDQLAAAGFVQRPADTPQRQAMLKRLPPNRFLERTHGSTVNYVLADPVNCNCLYVGTQQDYDNYRRSQLQAKIAKRQLLAAQTYADDDWDWNKWGPDFANFYGPFGPDYGW